LAAFAGTNLFAVTHGSIIKKNVPLVGEAAGYVAFQQAPAQRLTDFVQGKLSYDLPDCSYLPGIVSSPIHFWLPESIGRRLQEGFKAFDRKMKGFFTAEAVVVGMESRSSSPVRILRQADTFEHPQFAGLYPCGEGSGYAGGITSSAMDGENCAEKVFNSKITGW
jgi:uncharacterized FAD-dependent dehydrogenase